MRPPFELIEMMMVMIANLFDAGQWGGGRSRAPKKKKR